MASPTDIPQNDPAKRPRKARSSGDLESADSRRSKFPQVARNLRKLDKEVQARQDLQAIKAELPALDPEHYVETLKTQLAREK